LARMAAVAAAKRWRAERMLTSAPSLMNPLNHPESIRCRG
jgi:hypothetical protein